MMSRMRVSRGLRRTRLVGTVPAEDLSPARQVELARAYIDLGDTTASMALVQTNGDCAFIARLATRQDQRGRGLAQALLVDAFRVSAEHGHPKAELSTDSRTGALGLYEKVGMKVTSTWVNRATHLGGAR